MLVAHPEFPIDRARGIDIECDEIVFMRQVIARNRIHL